VIQFTADKHEWTLVVAQVRKALRKSLFCFGDIYGNTNILIQKVTFKSKVLSTKLMADKLTGVLMKVP
jgi:hypothetical protein